MVNFPWWFRKAMDYSMREGESEIEWHRLSRRELEVAVLIGGGLELKEIAERMGITRGMVRNYCYAIVRRLGMRGKEEMIKLARERFKN